MLSDIKSLWTEKAALKYVSETPEELELTKMNYDNPKVREALQACDNVGGGEIVLILGPGGCGKSVIFRAVAHHVEKPLCMAPTGVAARNLQEGGWIGKPLPGTIHSCLNLAPSHYCGIDVAEKTAEKVKKQKWTHILVDEISMVSPILMDLIIYISQEADLPLILFGDPLQLQPVKESKGLDAFDNDYPYNAFFGAYGWILQDRSKLKCILLDAIYRQSNDKFKGMLNRIRTNDKGLIQEDIKILESRDIGSAEPPEDALVLCYENKEVNRINLHKRGKNPPHLKCNNKYKNIFLLEEGEYFFGKKEYGDIEWTDGKGDIGVYFLLPRKNEGSARNQVDIYPTEETDELKNALRNGKLYEGREEKIEKCLEIMPGDRIMILKNMRVPLIPANLEESLFEYIYTGEGGYYPPLGEDADNTRVVNGSLGTYYGRCNALVSNSKWSKVEGDRLEAAQKMARSVPPDEHLVVKLDNGEWILIPRCELPTIVQENKTKERKEINGAYLQFPIRVAYAITYHKSQGLTLEKVHLQIPNSYYDSMCSLGYLGLSRCKTLEGITVSNFKTSTGYNTAVFKCSIESLNFLNRAQAFASSKSEFV